MLPALTCLAGIRPSMRHACANDTLLVWNAQESRFMPTSKVAFNVNRALTDRIHIHTRLDRGDEHVRQAGETRNLQAKTFREL